MYKLQKEVLPLSKLKPCPRNLKRTSVEKYFRNEGMLVDWCSFKLTFNPRLNEEEKTELSGRQTEESEENGNEFGEVFHFRSQIPHKNYGSGGLLATIVPAIIGTFIGLILFGIFWNDEDETAPVFRNGGCDSGELVKRSCLTQGTYEQCGNQPGNEEDFFLFTGDEGRIEIGGHQGRAMTPLPPQYPNTHPNGSPAITYAV